MNNEQKNNLKQFALTWKDVMNFRSELFGFSALWIILFHVLNNVGFPHFRGSYLLELLLSVGNSGVDIFLFLSAVGLWHSAEKNTLPNFYRNRMLRILFPYLLVAVPFFAWYDFCVAKDGVVQFLLNLSAVNYWIDSSNYPIWYVSFVIILYAVYPFLHRFDKKTNHVGTAVLLVLIIAVECVLFRMKNPVYNNAERAFARIPVALAGVIMAQPVLEGRRIPGYQVAIGIVLWVFCFLQVTSWRLPMILQRYLCGVMAVCFVVVFAFAGKLLLVKGIRRILRWLGGMSFELYAVHVFLIRIIRYQDLWKVLPHKALWYIAIPMISVMAAWLVCRISARFNQRLFRRSA